MKHSFIIVLLLLLVLFSCGNKKDTEYIYESNGSFYKINYAKTIYAEKQPCSQINLAFLSQIDSFNPFLSHNLIEYFLKKALFTTLFYKDEKTGKPIKNIVSDYKITDDNLLYTFTIDKNIFFSDGNKLTTHDIIASLNLLFSVLKDSSYYKNFFLLNKKMQPQYIDDYSFTITLDKPNSNLLSALSDYPILSQKNIASIDKNVENYLKIWQKDYTSLVFSGPYTIESITNGVVTLKRNDKYFKKDKNKKNLPYCPKISLTTFDADYNNIADFFTQKKIDVMELNNYYFKSDFKKGQPLKNARIIYIGNDYKKIFFVYNNYSANSKIYIKNFKIRQKIVSIIGNILVKNKINRSDYLFSNNYKIKNYNKTELPDNNLDNRKEDFEGNTISLNILTLKNDITENFAQIIKKAFDKQQIETHIVKADYSQFIEKLFYDKDFDIALVKYDLHNKVTDTFELFSESDIGFYPFFDAMEDTNRLLNLKKVLVTQNKIQNTFKKIETYIFDSLQFTPVIYSRQYFLISDDIHNFKLNFDMENNFNLKTIEYIFKESY